jgi:hypothetical protein
MRVAARAAIETVNHVDRIAESSLPFARGRRLMGYRLPGKTVLSDTTGKIGISRGY